MKQVKCWVLVSLFIIVGCIKFNNNHNNSNNENVYPADTKLKNLFILGKIWGFLKYYHPKVIKGNLDWDNELLTIIPKIVDCGNERERNKVLIDWINSMGNIIEASNEKIDSNEIKIRPDLKWLNDSIELGSTLSKALQKIKTAKRNNESYYVSLSFNGNPKFEHEKAYDSIKYPNSYFRLLSLFRYWNIINYFYPDKYLIEKNWDSVLVEFIPKFQHDTSELDYKLTVLELITNVHDSHANIFGDSILINRVGKYIAPIRTAFIENKLVVTGLPFTNTGLDTGDIITAINNKPVEDIVREMLPLTPASNYPTQLRNISLKIMRTNDTIIQVATSQGGLHKIKCFNYIKKYREIFQRKDTCFKFLSSDVAYIYAGTIKNDYVDEIMDKCKKTKGLIIDLRCYPSDFIVYTLGKYLVPYPTDFAKFTFGSITTPGLFRFTQPVKVGDNDTNYYKGKVMILVNELTQSQAEFTAMAFRVCNNALVIGSTTAGADGDVSSLILPGNIQTAISGIGVYYPNGKETQRIGIVPDIVINPTLNSIKERQDELLKMAIQKINETGY